MEEMILESVKRQVQSVLDMEKILELTQIALLQQAGVKKHQGRLDKKSEEIGRYQKLLCSLYENLTDGVIDQEEYQRLKKTYTVLLLEAQGQAEAIRTQIEQIRESSMKRKGGTDQFKEYQNLTVLDRAVVVCFIEKILIYKHRQVKIIYNWQDEYYWLADRLLPIRK